MLIPKLQKKIHIVKIDIPWALSCIEEKFDDALIMLKNDCLIYGGAIRDIIAELPIKGDLDVAIPYNTYSNILFTFDNSSRWIIKDPVLLLQTNNNYKGAIKQFLNNIITYTNLSGKEVQLIQANPSRYKETNYNQQILNIVYNVDMVCSGVIMDIEGNIKEILPGAIEDCKNKQLNINPKFNPKQIHYNSLKKRILKLVKRGWHNNIDLEQYKENN